MKNLLTLKKYFAVYKVKLFWGFIFIILSNAGSLYIPLLIKNAINELQKPAVASGVLFHYALLVLLTSLFAGYFRYMIRQKIIVVSREIEYDLRHDFWKHRSEEHTSELQSLRHLVCRLLLEKKK